MPASTIDLEFADGIYSFALPLPQIREVQTKANAPIGAVYQRIVTGAKRVGDSIVLQPQTAIFYVDDLYAVIFAGLVGGGSGTVDGQRVEVRPQDARRLLEAYVHGRPLIEAWEIAFSVSMACMHGYTPPKSEPEGNADAAAEKTQNTKTSTSEEQSQT